MPGVNGRNNNFAEILPASIAGHVYLDANNNGVLDQGEPPIPGTTITLTGTDSSGNPVQGTAQTASDGSYLFTGLRAGNYTLTETQPAGYLQGQNSLGNLGGSMGQDQFFVQVPSEAQGINYDFGEVLPQVQPPQRPQDTGFGPNPDIGQPLSKRDFIGNAWMQWGW